MKKPHILKSRTVINRPLKEVFDFFTNVENLNRITPPALHFTITSPLPLKIKEGSLIDYKLKLNGIPFRWQTKITKWEPPYFFEDIQTKGPYKMWRHEHIFEEKDGETIMRDVIYFISPGGIFEFIPHKLFVNKKVQHILDYRKAQFSKIFP